MIVSFGESLNDPDLVEANMIDSKESQNIKTQSTHSSGIKDPFQFREIMNKISTSQELGSENSVHEFSFEEEGKLIINFL